MSSDGKMRSCIKEWFAQRACTTAKRRAHSTDLDSLGDRCKAGKQHARHTSKPADSNTARTPLALNSTLVTLPSASTAKAAAVARTTAHLPFPQTTHPTSSPLLWYSHTPAASLLSSCLPLRALSVSHRPRGSSRSRPSHPLSRAHCTRMSLSTLR